MAITKFSCNRVSVVIQSFCQTQPLVGEDWKVVRNPSHYIASIVMGNGKKTTLNKTKTTMRYILTLLIMLFAELSFAQSNFPDFLQGTWKMENKEIYEHWDKLNPSSLKGFSYKLKDGQMTISEYLDISETNNEITYTATVLNQNVGKGVSFKLTKTDST